MALENISYYMFLGLSVILWTGIIAILLFIATATVAVLTTKRIKNIPVKWHTLLAKIAILFGLIHVVLVIAARF